jgi:hypothetical protein
MEHLHRLAQKPKSTIKETLENYCEKFWNQETEQEPRYFLDIYEMEKAIILI